jgi:hypothetical protein
MKNALKIKLAVVLYIIYWWLTITFCVPSVTMHTLFNAEIDFDIYLKYLMALIVTNPAINRLVNFVVDLVINVPLTKNEQEYYGIDETYLPWRKSLESGFYASALFWMPTLINFQIQISKNNWVIEDTIFWTGFCKFFIVAFLFYCIDELLVEAIKKRLPKCDS